MKSLIIKIGYALYIVYGEQEADRLLDELYKIIFV